MATSLNSRVTSGRTVTSVTASPLCPRPGRRVAWGDPVSATGGGRWAPSRRLVSGPSPGRSGGGGEGDAPVGATRSRPLALSPSYRWRKPQLWSTSTLLLLSPAPTRPSACGEGRRAPAEPGPRARLRASRFPAAARFSSLRPARWLRPPRPSAPCDLCLSPLSATDLVSYFSEPCSERPALPAGLCARDRPSARGVGELPCPRPVPAGPLSLASVVSSVAGSKPSSLSSCRSNVPSFPGHSHRCGVSLISPILANYLLGPRTISSYRPVPPATRTP